MVHVPSLSQRDRLILAELSGVAGRYGTGADQDAPRDAAIAAVRDVTTNAWLLGIAAGVAMADSHGMSLRTVELLDAAGADMAVAHHHAGEVRERFKRAGIRYEP
ncbi:hypothetical protein [Micromonospora sp. NPDC004551]|uniref:hypothetical protein n=1 Tax=Micromonospora sp. NPDC004551 TaxID=3154284 RepID=UPI0033BAAA79